MRKSQDPTKRELKMKLDNRIFFKKRRSDEVSGGLSVYEKGA